MNNSESAVNTDGVSDDSATYSRRQVLGGLACSATALAFGASLSLPLITTAMGDNVTVLKAEPNTQYGFWVETASCDGCGKCVDACKVANGTQAEYPSRRKVALYTNGYGVERFVTTSCMHCAVPPCVEVCPASAISKRAEDGIVVVDHDRCIGCKYCFHACPYSVPVYTNRGMEKCDCCIENGTFANGSTACVDACTNGALHFGPMETLLRLSGGKAKQFAAKTGPSLLLS